MFLNKTFILYKNNLFIWNTQLKKKIFLLNNKVYTISFCVKKRKNYDNFNKKLLSSQIEFKNEKEKKDGIFNIVYIYINLKEIKRKKKNL